MSEPVEPDASEAKSWRRKLAERWLGLRMAHEATMLEDFRDLAKRRRAVSEDYQRKMLDLPTTPGTKVEVEGEDALHIGDVIHQAAPRAAKAAAVATGNAWLVPVLSALAAGGIGTGATAYLTRPTSPPPAVVSEQPKPVDLRVKWWVEDGKVRTEVEPIKE